MTDIAQATAPDALPEPDRSAIFTHLSRRLAAHRHTAQRYALAEADAVGLHVNADTCTLPDAMGTATSDAFLRTIDAWAQEVLSAAWIACQQPGGGACPTLGPLADSSLAGLPPLPDAAHLTHTLTLLLLLHLSATQRYSAHTRALFASLGAAPDEHAAAGTLKHPHDAARAAAAIRAAHEHASAPARAAGIALGALAGGIVLGVTGGLGAPLVGAGVGGLLGALGLGASAAGALATALAGSAAVCGTLFGAYGARASGRMVARHAGAVRDLALVPVRAPVETLAVRVCVGGWVGEDGGVVQPWTVFGDDMDTYALQWEVEALQALSGALRTLVRAQAMQYVKAQLLRRTVLAALLSSLAPLTWLRLGRIVDNPWSNACARARKAGGVLADLLAARAFGARPVVLAGCSLGALVVFEALTQLAARPPGETVHLVQDAYLLGAPVQCAQGAWAAARRVVAGRLVNAYARDDYVLAVLARVSGMAWGVAGLAPVEVVGVEDVEADGVDGHLKWRAMVGRCLVQCGVPGVSLEEAEKQAELVLDTEQELDPALDKEDADAEAVEPGMHTDGLNVQE
ncbi:hypothetical protein BC834DRAFT_990554 [Gloeopeniophorella convolvens]|nr:hypothetical protein BC834DRAFT_990554 [Gloeopeniophorella convolvens]